MNREATDTIAFVARVEQSLATLLTTEEERLAARGMAEVQALVQGLRRLALSPAKRVRPTFCYWGWRGTDPGGGGKDDDDEDVVRACVALELVHTCALIHDDLMDRSDRRRGKPSLHRALAEWCRGKGLGGDPERFGTSSALLAGHLCLTWADSLLDGLSPAVSRAARRMVRELRTEVTAGQYLDLLGEVGATDGSLSSCLRLAQLKTGRYTVARPLQLGGVVGCGGPGLLATYRAYGRPLGVAFQLADDLADVLGPPDGEEAPGTEDLRAGKTTALVVLGRQEADPRQLAILDRLIGSEDLGEAGAEMVRDVLVATGAVDRVADLIAGHVAEAKRAVEAGALPPSAASALLDLADAVGQPPRGSFGRPAPVLAVVDG
ncbi:MAG: polyprenyl synthetase family protein [Acidimicrobiales bacterium]